MAYFYKVVKLSLKNANLMQILKFLFSRQLKVGIIIEISLKVTSKNIIITEHCAQVQRFKPQKER